MARLVIDWHRTTREERRCLNGPVNILRQRKALNWGQAFIEAFGTRGHVGAGYEDNLRKGRIAADKAWRLHEWIKGHDPALANEVEEAIRELRTRHRPGDSEAWQSLLHSAAYAGVRVVKTIETLGALDFARRHPVSPADLFLMDEFYFELETPISGYAIAFHGRRGLWSVLPLSQPSSIIRTFAGTAILPVDDEGRPDPLQEDEDAGQHGFLFAILDVAKTQLPKMLPEPGMPIRPERLDDLAAEILAISENRRHLARVNLLFKAQPGR